MPDNTTPSPISAGSRGKWRILHRLCFFVLATSMVIDVFPWQTPLDGIKRAFNQVQIRTGLWQGQWSMFAPNPSISNRWLVAKLFDDQDVLINEWSSPYWPNTSGSERFVNFRAMNYFNRVSTSQNLDALADLAKYLKKQMASEAGLTHDSLKIRVDAEIFRLLVEESGELTPPEDLVWVPETRILFEDPLSPASKAAVSAPSAFEFAPLWTEDDQ